MTERTRPGLRRRQARVDRRHHPPAGVAPAARWSGGWGSGAGRTGTGNLSDLRGRELNLKRTVTDSATGPGRPGPTVTHWQARRAATSIQLGNVTAPASHGAGSHGPGGLQPRRPAAAARLSESTMTIRVRLRVRVSLAVLTRVCEAAGPARAGSAGVSLVWGRVWRSGGATQLAAAGHWHRVAAGSAD